MRRGRLLTLLAGAVGVAALVFFGLAGRGAARRPAPALPAAAFVGPRVTLAALRGRPAFVVFWASWCEPCRREAPSIQASARRLSGRVAVIGVDYNDPDRGAARRFLVRYHWTFPSLLDGDGSTGLRYGLTGLPTTYLLDAGGRIVRSITGPQTPDSLQRALRAL